MAAIIYLPRAAVTLSPATYERPADKDIILSGTQTEPDFVRFVLPARFMDKTSEETVRRQRTAIQVTEDFARGKVKLINNQDSEQPLLPKTHLKHEATGAQFLTDAAVRLPAEGSLDITVTAEGKGATGNVPAGRFLVDRLPQSMQSVVYGESSTAFTGGEQSDSPLTADELNAAKKEAQDKAREKAWGELTQATGGAAVRPDLTITEVEEEQSSAEAGSKAAAYEVRAKVRVRSLVADDKDLLGLMLLALRALPQGDEQFVSYKPESFRVEIARADFERGEAHLKGHITGVFTKKTPPTVFDAGKLAGMTVKEAQDYLGKQDGVGSVEVKLSPFWVSTIPGREGAVRIEIKQRKS